MCPSLFFWRCSWGGDALFIRKTIPIIATLPNVVAKWKFCAIEKQYSSLIFSSKHHEISVWNFYLFPKVRTVEKNYASPCPHHHLLPPHWTKHWTSWFKNQSDSISVTCKSWMASLSDKYSGYDILQQIIEYLFLYFHTCF